MASLNEEIANEMIEQAINVERASAAQSQKILASLKELEAELIKELSSINPTESARAAAKVARLEKLIASAQEAITKTYKEAASSSQLFLTEIAKVEAAFTTAAINNTIGFDLAQGVVESSTLRTLAKDTLIQGAPSREWWARQGGDLLARFTDSMRQGLTANENLQSLINRVRGTKEAGYNNGIFATTRRQAESLVRTSSMSVANEARIESYQANEDIIKAIQWRSTLDTRTSTVCAVRDGLKWNLEKKPIGHDLPLIGPPAHWRCRSTTTPVTRSWAELSGPNAVQVSERKRGSVQDLMRKKLEERGWTDERIDTALKGGRAAMDGSVAPSTTYEKWLKGRSPETQKEILGPGRYKLWKDEKMPLSSMLDQSGNPLTIEQLQAKL